MLKSHLALVKIATTILEAHIFHKSLQNHDIIKEQLLEICKTNGTFNVLWWHKPKNGIVRMLGLYNHVGQIANNCT